MTDRSDLLPVRRALVSVYDKKGLATLARGLHELGVELLSTGTTARAIRDAGVEVTEVSEVTGFPEILDGRVKTLHPAIHAAILADRSKETHRAALAEHGIDPIDLVVANLYPFGETVAAPDVTDEQAIEMIDVGGPTMVRAAAKNHAHVAVVTETSEYEALLQRLHEEGGLDAGSRRVLAASAFAHTASYDADVRDWLLREEAFPPRFGPVYRKSQDLRYGENPHQAAAYYVERGTPWGLGSAVQLQGKELSYNNLLDTDAAWLAVQDFSDPCVAIIKHTNPAGLAVGASVAAAYPRALAGDPVSAFGGIVAANREVDAETAKQILEVFAEVIVAPGFSDEARGMFADKPNLRVLEVARAVPPEGERHLRSVSGGLLVQALDVGGGDPDRWSVVTRAQPDEASLAELAFAWTAVKHVKSNGIVLARDRCLVGVGAGQMSRVDSVRLAVEKSEGRARGAVLASDAFFPFPDGPALAIDAGVVAIVQPGGSKRDSEVIAACDEAGVPLLFTGERHFRH